jgi:hypothetical protein
MIPNCACGTKWLIGPDVSDDKGARHLLERLPRARELLADRGYDAD